MSDYYPDPTNVPKGIFLALLQQHRNTMTKINRAMTHGQGLHIIIHIQ